MTPATLHAARLHRLTRAQETIADLLHAAAYATGGVIPDETLFRAAVTERARVLRALGGAV